MSFSPFQSILIFAGIFVVFWLFIGYLLPIGLPFLIGFLLARAAEPATALLQDRLHFRRKAAAACSVSAAFLLSLAVLILLFGFVARQLQHLADLLPQLEEVLYQGTAALRDWLLRLSHRLPGTLGEVAAGWTARLFSDSSTMMEQALLQIPKLATRLLSSLSQGLFGLVTGIISAYMIADRLPLLRRWLEDHQSAQWQQRWLPALKAMRKALGGWLLAEAKLACLAFGGMLLGFFLLRIENSLLWAGLITLVDAFPILGVGTILVPWSLVCLLQDDLVRGIGLLAIYGVIWLSRSILEPKLVGKGLGLDPLVTLIVMYTGWKLWGIPGMLLSPILALTATQILKQLR